MPVLRNLPIFGFLGLWIIPVLFCGFADQTFPLLPDILARRSNVSRLFAFGPSKVAVYEFQFRNSDSENFETLDERSFFVMQPFGYRTRMQRALSLANESRRRALADWLKGSLERQGHGQQIAEIRLLVFPYDIAASHPPDGHYHQQKSSEVDTTLVRILSEYDYDVPRNP